MNALIEPRSADEGLLAILHRAKSLIEANDFDKAIPLYAHLLDGELADTLRGEVLTNLGAALCLSARGKQGPDALAQLERARALLTTAISYRPRRDAPVAWATTRANLALVFLARYELFGKNDDLMSAHMALDSTQQILRQASETTLHDWVIAIRDHLVELRERRATRR